MQECKLNNIMVQYDCLIDNKNMILNALSVHLPYQDNSSIVFKKLSTLYVYGCLLTDPYVIEDNGVLHTLTTVWYYMIDNISQQHLDYRTVALLIDALRSSRATPGNTIMIAGL